jgi:hypothetical protein
MRRRVIRGQRVTMQAIALSIARAPEPKDSEAA